MKGANTACLNISHKSLRKPLNSRCRYNRRFLTVVLFFALLFGSFFFSGFSLHGLHSGFTPSMSMKAAAQTLDDSGDEASAGTPTPIRAAVEGPTSLVIGESTGYKLTITGGPADDPSGEEAEEWGYTAYLRSSDEDIDLESLDVKPTEASPVNDSSANNTFVINITAPQIPIDLELVVNATSRKGNDTAYVTKIKSIKVVAPIMINVTVWNRGLVNVQKVNVKFYVDDQFVGDYLIDNLNSNSSVNITYNWTTKHEFSPGKHILRVSVDADNDMVELSEGDNTIEMPIYIADESEDRVWNWIWLIMGIFLAILFILWAFGGKSKYRR